MTDKELLTMLDRHCADHDLTLSDIASALQISRVCFSRWRGGQSVSPRLRRKLIAYLNSDQTPAPARIAERHITPDRAGLRPVPVLSLTQAASIAPDSAPPWFDPAECHSVGFANPKPGDFAVQVVGMSMMPWYPPGTHLLIGKDDLPVTGNRVIAMLADYSEPVFKIYIDRGDTFDLVSLNRQDGIAPIRLNKMSRTAWYWVWPVRESRRDEDAVDEAFKKLGLPPFWAEN